MRLYFITFRSITYAQRGEKLLTAAGYRVSLQRTPRALAEQGCGYSLRVQTADPASAAEALRSGGLKYGRIFAVKPDGTREEITV